MYRKTIGPGIMISFVFILFALKLQAQDAARYKKIVDMLCHTWEDPYYKSEKETFPLRYNEKSITFYRNGNISYDYEKPTGTGSGIGFSIIKSTWQLDLPNRKLLFLNGKNVQLSYTFISVTAKRLTLGINEDEKIIYKRRKD